MSTTLTGDETWSALRRAWIERHAAATGTICRADITGALGISPAQASNDLQGLLAEHPGCLSYDLRAKRYRWTGKRPRLPVPEFVRLL